MTRASRVVVPAVISAVMALMIGPSATPAGSSSTPRWMLHVAKYPGGISNGVRAMVKPEVVEAQAKYAASRRTAAAAKVGQNNIQMNDDSNPPLPQNETSVAFNLDDPLIAVAGANDYVSAGLALMRTTDGGRTWTTLFQAPQFFPTREPCTGGDPAIEYSLRDQAFYATTLCFFRSRAESELHVWKSVDNSLTWTPPRLASVVVSNFDPATGTDDSVFYDKEYIAIDNNPGSPFYGRIYVTYVKFHFLPSGFSDYCPVQVAYTDDIPTNNPQLAVWSRTAVVPDNPGDDGRGPTANQFAYAQVEKDGDLDLTYAIEECNTALDSALMFQKSTDGGATFLPAPIRIDKPGQFIDNPDLGDLLPPTFFRAPISPSLDVNKKTGTLAYVYQNNVNRSVSGADISVQLSTDGGFHWTDMQTISTSGGGPAPKDQFFPWIDSDDNGRFYVIWFDRRLDPQNRRIDTFQAVSLDNGATWPNVRISTVSWNPDLGFFTSGAFIGDYNGIAASNRVVYPVWTDGRNNAFAQTGIGETDIFTNIQAPRK